MLKTRSAVALATILALTGCGSTGDTATAAVDPAVAAFQSDWSASTAAQDTLNGYANTAFTAMPSSGTADFAGYLVAGYPGATAAGGTGRLAGKARLTADFAAGKISGTATDFLQAAVTPTGQVTSANALGGSLTIGSGEIGSKPPHGTARLPNNLTLHIGGTLTAAGGDVTADVTLFGKFKGSPIAGLAASSSAAENAGYPAGTLVIDGTARSGFGMSLTALKQ